MLTTCRLPFPPTVSQLRPVKISRGIKKKNLEKYVFVRRPISPGQGVCLARIRIINVNPTLNFIFANRLSM